MATKYSDAVVVYSDAGSCIEYCIWAGGPALNAEWLREVGNDLDKMINNLYYREGADIMSSNIPEDTPLAITAHTGHGYKMTYTPERKNLIRANRLSKQDFTKLMRDIDSFMMRRFPSANLVYATRMDGQLNP